MQLLPLAPDDWGPQVSRPLGGKCGGGNGLREETLSSGAGVFLRRRYLHREPAARERDRAKAETAGLDLVVQQPGKRELRHDQADEGLRAAAVSGGVRIREPADT